MIIGKLEANFWIWMDKYPHVFFWMVDRANKYHREGKRTSINALFEEMRAEGKLMRGIGKDHNDVKLSNNHRAFLGRLIVYKYPSLASVFNFRQQKVQASFGPRNSTLPSGGHRH